MSINAKKYLPIILACVMMSVAVSCFIFFAHTQTSSVHNSTEPPVSFTHMYYENLRDLVRNSDTVIIGKALNTYGPEIINVSFTEDDPLYLEYMLCDLLVIDVAKGNVVNGDIITIKQNTASDVITLNDDGETIIFLYDFRDITDIAPFVPMNPKQGFIDYNDPNQDALVTDFGVVEALTDSGVLTGRDIWNLVFDYSTPMNQGRVKSMENQ
jgi:hypothetical protein